MVHDVWRRLAPCVAACACLALAACGGGGTREEGPSAALPAAASASAATTALPPAADAHITVTAYTALRAQVAEPAPPAALETPAIAAWVADSQQSAVAQLKTQLAAAEINPVVVLPLAHAALRVFASAARGETMAELVSHFDLAPPAALAAQQTGRVRTQLWSNRGLALRVDFLRATDANASWHRLQSWSAGETGFADGSAAADEVFTDALKQVDPSLELAFFDRRTDIRLLIAQALHVGPSWPTVAPADGVFMNAEDFMVRLPILRLTQGVTRFRGSDFTANLLAAGDLRVMTLRPEGASLAAFSQDRLQPALAEAVQVLVGAAGAAEPGEMVLPKAALSLSLHGDGPLVGRGVRLVYDEVHADMRGLDDAGGTYLQSRSPAARLTIASDGMALDAAHALAFTFSPNNVNVNPVGTTLQLGSVTTGFSSSLVCTWPEPDLRHFFLAILDSDGAVLSLTAIKAVGGEPVVPQCSNAIPFQTEFEVEPTVVTIVPPTDGP